MPTKRTPYQVTLDRLYLHLDRDAPALTFPDKQRLHDAVEVMNRLHRELGGA